MLGHSYGAQVALAAAAEVQERVRALVLYEPPWPRALGPQVLARLEALGRGGDWDGFAAVFFREVLCVPLRHLDALRRSALLATIGADARTSPGDAAALGRYGFRAERFSALRRPVVLQIGTEGPRDIYVTDALAAALPEVSIQELPGQAHEGKTTARAMYAEAVSRALLPRA